MFLFKNVWKECRTDFKNIQDSGPYGDLPFHECWLDFSTLFTVTFHAVFSENTFFLSRESFLLTVRLCLKCTDLSFKVSEDEGESLSLSALSLFCFFYIIQAHILHSVCTAVCGAAERQKLGAILHRRNCCCLEQKLVKLAMWGIPVPPEWEQTVIW